MSKPQARRLAVKPHFQVLGSWCLGGIGIAMARSFFISKSISNYINGGGVLVMTARVDLYATGLYNLIYN